MSVELKTTRRKQSYKIWVVKDKTRFVGLINQFVIQSHKLAWRKLRFFLSNKQLELSDIGRLPCINCTVFFFFSPPLFLDDTQDFDKAIAINLLNTPQPLLAISICPLGGVLMYV